MFFCSFTPGLGSPWHFGSWWREGIAFQKAFLWACLVEVLGFGCMSGPLGFRIWPPFTAFLHFLRPGTTKLAPFPDLPVFGGTTRTWLDVALYAAFVRRCCARWCSPRSAPAQLVPIVVLLPLCGLGDKTILLAARVEHHFAMIVCFLLAGNWIAACKAVQLAIWFWAGVSKLTVAFGYVVPIMTANNPLREERRAAPAHVRVVSRRPAAVALGEGDGARRHVPRVRRAADAALRHALRAVAVGRHGLRA